MFQWIAIVAVVATLLGMAGHYLLFGAKHPELRRERAEVRRFNLWHRCTHITTLVTFVTLSVTGFWAAFTGSPLSGWLLVVHWLAAPVFALALVAMALTWAELCLFEKHDIDWARRLGGYFGGGHGDIPAGMFNGGQKAFFWVIVLLGIVSLLSGLGRMVPVFESTGQLGLLLVHRYSTLFLVLSILVHLYLGTIANPGTFMVVVTGYVSQKWAAHHHPVWWQRLTNGGKDRNETES